MDNEAQAQNVTKHKKIIFLATTVRQCEENGQTYNPWNFCGKEQLVHFGMRERQTTNFPQQQDFRTRINFLQLVSNSNNWGERRKQT